MSTSPKLREVISAHRRQVCSIRQRPSTFLVETRDESGKRVREMLRPFEYFSYDPGGWRIYTTRLALLCLLDAEDFHSGVEAVVRLGGDADTNGAVAGDLLEHGSAWEAYRRSGLSLCEGKKCC